MSDKFNSAAVRRKFLEIAVKRTSRGKPPTSAEVGQELGLSSEESAEIARHLAGQKLVRYDGGMWSDNPVFVEPQGREEIERQPAPWWERVLCDREVLIAVLSALLGAASVKLLDWLFGKQ